QQRGRLTNPRMVERTHPGASDGIRRLGQPDACVPLRRNGPYWIWRQRCTVTLAEAVAIGRVFPGSDNVVDRHRIFLSVVSLLRIPHLNFRISKLKVALCSEVSDCS